MSFIKDQSVIILCGGRGSRLGSLGDKLPKALALVHGKPILWHAILRLHMSGFRHFILPLGYKAEKIVTFIDQELSALDAQIDAIDTGEGASIGERISKVRSEIKGNTVVLINGDTVFDFDAAAMLTDHQASGMDLTLTSCQIVSNFGLLITDDEGRLVDFSRNCAVPEFVVNRGGAEKARGFINAGIAVLNVARLGIPGIADTKSFEQFLYPQIIADGRGRHEHINGFWHAMDTEKDVEIANADPKKDTRSAGTHILSEKIFNYARSQRVLS